jgi:uncharacterized protein YlxP (DUF503 family)
MTFGACKVKLRLAENHSLKGKRQVVKSITAQVRNRFNVSVAEVEDQDLWQLATVAVACVGSSAPSVNETISHVVNFISQGRWDVELLDYEIELLPIS